MKRIIVPTDFSECAKNASQVAVKLAKECGAEVHFMHSVHAPVDWNNVKFHSAKVAMKSDQEKKGLFPETRARIGHAKHKLSTLARNTEKKGVKAKVHLMFNAQGKDFTAYAHKQDSDMIVIGSHGDSGIHETLIGSNAQKVVRLAKCPVLVVKKARPNFKLKDILYASNFTEKDVNSNLKRLDDVARKFKAMVHLVYINTPGWFEDSDTSYERVTALAKKYLKSRYSVHVHSDFTVIFGVSAVAKKINPDVISLTTHGYTGVRQLFHENITEALVNSSSLPVLSLNMPKGK